MDNMLFYELDDEDVPPVVAENNDEDLDEENGEGEGDVDDVDDKNDKDYEEGEDEEEEDEEIPVGTQGSSRDVENARKRRSGSAIRSQHLTDDNKTDAYLERIGNLPPRGQDDKLVSIGVNWKLDEATYNKLYDYQQTGVEWLLDKYDQKVGAILADEMGLGKTIQAITFLRAISETEAFNSAMNAKGLGKVLLVCPASLLQQWIDELHKWFTKCRVLALHSTNSTGSTETVMKLLNARPRNNEGCVLVTTYNMFVRHSDTINKIIWSIALLDEGHKIKNTDSKNYKAVSKIPTPCRYVLTGSPIQNNLGELWTLMEFIYPGKLGSFIAFSNKIIRPIQEGSYINANLQKQETSYQCALVLQQAVKPYILRRLKSDEQERLALPGKHEQILFCNLTSRQRKLYKSYLKSDEVQRILSGKLDAFVGFTKMFHICNSPDIYEQTIAPSDEMTFSSYRDSGKLLVLMKLLKEWNSTGDNKVLIYTQKKSVVKMLEYYFKKKNFNFLTMTGETPIGKRHNLVERFTADESIFCFILTTRVGGIGLNLTAANRVVIYDPDWNPTTDQQAKERAWRIGQTRNVVIYRLITVGTIEEKTYLKQIHKEFLASRVLQNGKTREVIPKETLRELFMLAPEGVKGSEAGLYVDGETIPKERKRKSSNEDEEASTSAGPKKAKKNDSTKKKIRKSCIADFEDKKVLASLFEGNMLSSIIEHEKAVMNEHNKMAMRATAKRHATDAAKIFLHVEGRPSRKWIDALMNTIAQENEGAPVVPIEKEEVSPFWATVNANLRVNDGKSETDKRVAMAHDLYHYLKRNKDGVAKEDIHRVFNVKKLEGIQLFFFEEMLNTLCDVVKGSTNKWKLKDKYL